MNVRAASSQAMARTITARQQLVSLKGGNLFLREANVTPEVAPGGVIDVQSVVSNGALLIDPFDKDSCVHDANDCTKGPTETGGYCYEVEIEPSWTSNKPSGPNCIKTTEVGTIDKEHTASLTAPTGEGSYVVGVRLTAKGSGQTGVFQRTVTVTETAGQRPGPGQRCDSDGQCPNGQVCKDGQCRDCGAVDKLLNSSQCGGIEGTINSLIILVVLILLVSLVAD